jgi:hypothetical protein
LAKWIGKNVSRMFQYFSQIEKVFEIKLEIKLEIEIEIKLEIEIRNQSCSKIKS